MVFGNLNFSVEVVYDGCMKCVVVVGKYFVYELGVGDLVVWRLDELFVIDLKNFFDLDFFEF